MKNILIAVLLFIPAVQLSAAKLVLDGSPDVQVFFNDGDQVGHFCHVVGVIDSLGTREFSTDKEKELGIKIQGKTKSLVRLTDQTGIMNGSILYVINERNLVVSKMTVSSVFSTVSFDEMCVGYGNFRNVQKDYRVVRAASETDGEGGASYIADGNRYKENGDISKAIESYQKAIVSDSRNPEAHSALGYIYLEQNMVQFAMKEFAEGYRNIGRLYDKEDRYNLLKGCASSRYTAVFHSELPKGNQIRDKYVTEGIKFANEAVTVYPDSVDMNYMLGSFYYERSGADQKLDTVNEVKTRNCMLKVLKEKDDHVDALVILAKLYKKHGNRSKAELYASKAVSVAPQDTSVRDLLTSIKAMK